MNLIVTGISFGRLWKERSEVVLWTFDMLPTELDELKRPRAETAGRHGRHPPLDALRLTLIGEDQHFRHSMV